MPDIWDEWHKSDESRYPREKVVQFCFRNYPERQGLRVLDLGCGSGMNTVFLATEGFDVAATDKSPTGIQNTRRKLDALGLKAELRVEGADVISFLTDSFDLVICVGVYDSTGPTVAAASIGRVREVLSPGGRGMFLFCSDRDDATKRDDEWRLYGYTRVEVEKLFEGFSELWIDRYISTYEGGRIEDNEWLITVRN